MLREAEAAAEQAHEEERLRLEAVQREREEREAAEHERLLREAEAAAALARAAEQQRQEEEQRRRAAEEAAERERQLRERETESLRKKRTAREKKAARAAAPPPETVFLAPKASAAPASAEATAGKPSASVPAPSSSVPARSASVPTPAFAKASAGKPSASVPEDPWADFRACVNGASADSILRLMPIEDFARSGRTARPTYPPAAESTEPPPNDAVGLMGGLNLPIHLAAFEYPRECRIRRVRVMAPADEEPIEAPGPVIVSRRALGEIRNA
jgi:hypothetical protein